MSRSPKKLLVGLFLAALLAAAVYGSGFYLSPSDPLRAADGIVVVSGGETEARVSEGVSLYRLGYAPKLLFSGAALSGSTSNAKSMRRIALSANVRDEDIMLEENARDTAENAKFTAAIAAASGWHSIILVTSPYHQRRASTEFRHHYPSGFTIINHPAKDSSWRKNGWWWNPDDYPITFSELAKNAYLFIYPGQK